MVSILQISRQTLNGLLTHAYASLVQDALRIYWLTLHSFINYCLLFQPALPSLASQTQTLRPYAYAFVTEQISSSSPSTFPFKSTLNWISVSILISIFKFAMKYGWPSGPVLAFWNLASFTVLRSYTSQKDILESANLMSPKFKEGCYLYIPSSTSSWRCGTSSSSQATTRVLKIRLSLMPNFLEISTEACLGAFDKRASPFLMSQVICDPARFSFINGSR
jgi:hypothetical protein